MKFREKIFGKQIFLEHPFPLEKLRELNFGNADGARDDLIEDTFVKTSSVSTFLLNKHSIICGPIGSGKSALFRLLKEKSPELDSYNEFIMVSVEESISFKMLKSFVDTVFQKFDSDIIYQLLWKLQIVIRICEEISKRESFPLNKEERDINEFLKVIDSKGSYTNIVDKLKYLIDNYSLKIDGSLLHFPFSADLSIPGGSAEKTIEINLDKIIHNSTVALGVRGAKVLVIIDKVDRFVAGEEYEVQRKYIEGLLDVEDDMSSKENIFFKIFIRADLFARLNFTGLGYDKVNDNTLKLKWSPDEIIHFMAKRIFTALKTVGLMEGKDIFLTANLKDYHLTGLNILRLIPNLFPKPIYKILFDEKRINGERTIGLLTYLNKSIVTKVFPREIYHFDVNGKKESIDIFNFISTHFKNGRNEITPRHLLIFLKEVQSNVTRYYDDNPDQRADSVVIDGNVEWKLFKSGFIYDAYINAKNICMKNIGNAEEKWTKYFVVFQSKRGHKTIFDFKWFRSVFTDIDEDEIVHFISYLQSTGFFRIADHHADIKRRKHLNRGQTTFLCRPI